MGGSNVDLPSGRSDESSTVSLPDGNSAESEEPLRPRRRKRRSDSVGRPSGSNGRPSGSNGRPCGSTSGSGRQAACCQKSCLTKFRTPELRLALAAWADQKKYLDRDNFTQYLYQLLVEMQALCRQSPSATRPWIFLGHRVCRVAWKKMVGIGNARLNRLLVALRGGLPAPKDLRRWPTLNRERPALQHADSFFHWAYDHLAETFASDLPEQTSVAASMAALAAQNGLTEWLIAPGATGPVTQASVETRFLPPGSFAELHELYVATAREGRPATYSTFLRCYKQRWSRTLKIRVRGHHAKCPDCERFKEFRRLAHSPADISEVSQAYHAHLRAQDLDRRVDAQLAVLAERTARGETSPAETLLNICLDGMDQAKFRCPRSLSLSKDFQNLWRPELHVVGGIADGLVEAFWLANPTVPKNADTQATVAALLLDHCMAALAARGQPMPAKLRIHTDNAASEGKNQTMMKFCAWLVWRRAFESVEMTMFRVGHTHNKQDQRFGVAATALSRTQRLEVIMFVWFPTGGLVAHVVCLQLSHL